MKRIMTVLLLVLLVSEYGVLVHAEPPAKVVAPKAETPTKKAAKAKKKVKKAEPLVVPDYSDIDVDLLEKASQASLASAVAFLKKLSAEDTDGWFVPPARRRKVVDHETIMLRYREEKREIPVYEYEREQYEVLVKRRSGQSVDAVVTFKKETRSRVTSRKQVGTRTVTTRVRDEKGPIEVAHKRPIYGPGGPDVWPRNGLGDNALALYALRKAGVPEDDPLVWQLTQNMSDFMWTYGLPDATWDLAWTTAAFSTLTSPGYQSMVQRLVSKLLDGQIREGAARGLWGPVCINMPLLVEWIPKSQEAGAELLKARAAAKNNGDKEVEREGIAEQAHREVTDTIKRIAMSAMAGPSVESAFTIVSPEDISVVMAGLAHYTYNQTSADLGSTALVLFALRDVASRGLLPEGVWRPKESKIRSELAPAILARTAFALANAQLPQGGWNEMNKHQVFKAGKAGIMFPGLPPKAVAYPELPSPENLLTQAQGFQTLANTGHIVGMDKLMGRYGKNIKTGLVSQRNAAENLIKAFEDAAVVGGQNSPYECAFFLRDVANSFEGVGDERPDLKGRIAYALLTQREKDGSWSTTQRSYLHPALPTSLLARMRVLTPKEKGTPTDYAAPHVGKRFEALEQLRLSGRHRQTVRESVVPTALAMLFLADDTRPPVAGQCLWSETTKPSLIMPMITTVMQKRYGPVFRYANMARPMTLEALSAQPGVLIRGSGSFDPSADEKKALGAYLAKGGFVLVEMAADAKGLPFYKQAQTVLQGLLPGSKVSNIGADKELLGNMAGKLTVKALKRQDGLLSAVFLPIAAPRSRSGLSAPVAAEIAYNTLLQKIDPAVLEADYVSASAEELDVEPLLEQLFAGPSAVPEPAPDAVEADEPEAEQKDAQAPAKPEVKKPAADEVW